jgi:hypothetical protein
MRTYFLTGVIAFTGCAGGSGAAVGAAAANVVIAGAVGAARVASGQCFTACPTGTRCNEKTAMCEEIPCRDRCHFNEECDESGLLPRCVPKRAVEMKIGEKSPAPQELETPQ